MIDSARLENGMIAVARRYAPALVPPGWKAPGDYPGALPDLARALASYNVLVMAASAPQSAVKAWTDGYLDLYRVLSTALFPSFTRASAFYIDQQTPPIVAIYGEATPVIAALAGFVAPYVVARQGTRPVEVEILGMMDMILEELEATDLPRDEYRRLRDSGASLLRQLLDSEVRQQPVTPATRPIFGEMAAQRPPTASESRGAGWQGAPPPDNLPEPPAPPATLPEEQGAAQAQGQGRTVPPPPPEFPPEEASRRAFDPDAVPIFFNPGRTASLPKPPVPTLPPREKR
jgi:hypothetical protein